MSGSSNIEWTDATWNPIRGCSRVSEGCRNCYAEAVAARFSEPGMAYEGLARRTPSGPRWTGVVRLIEEHLTDPLRWKRPRKVFVNSMSDLFHEKVTDEWIDRIFAVMALAPQHTFQILTKRPERMRAYCSDDAVLGRLIRKIAEVTDGVAGVTSSYLHTPDGLSGFNLPNVWLGVSCEDQETADERIPILLQTPAAIRFISAEPLLRQVDLGRLVPVRGYEICPLTGWRSSRISSEAGHTNMRLDWVIVGGESGPGARPCDVAWIRSIVKQCRSANVPVFVKQLGSKPILVDKVAGNIGYRGQLKDWPSLPDGFYRHLNSRKGGDPSEWPEDLRVRESPSQ